MAHPELGRKILDDVIEGAGPIIKVENQARMEGRSMSMVRAPDKKAMEAIRKAEVDAEKKAAKEAAEAETAATAVAEAPPEAGDE